MELTIEQALQQGVAAHKEGKLQDAERLYRAILQSQPLHPDANHNLGLIAVSVNKPDVALLLFKTALEANPKIEQFWLSYIEALIKEKQFENARQILEQAKQQGVAREKLNALETELSSETQIQNVNSASPSQQQLNSLLEYYQNGRFSEAEKLAVEITQQFPQDQFAWKVLGAIFGQSGRTVEAKNANRTSVALSPQDAEAHSNLGVTLQELGRLDEALASYTQAIALNPDYGEAHYNLGVMLQELGRLDEALASYTQAIALKPDYAEAHYNLGNTLNELGRLDEAEASYTQAIALKPDFAEAHSNLGNTLQKLGRLEETEASYRAAVAVKSDYAEAHYNLGNTLQELGRLDEAEASYTQVIVLKPDYAEAHSNLGITLEELGRLNEAEASFTQAIALKPDLAEAHSNLGNTLKELGRLDEALASYTQAIALKPDYAEAYVNLGIALKNVKFSSSNPTLYTPLTQLLTAGNFTRPSDVARSILSLLKHDTQIKDLLLKKNSALSLNEATSIIGSLDKLPLLHHLMRVCPLPELQLEELFVAMRSLLLKHLDKMEVSPELIYFLSTLSMHCFTNEYVYIESDEETHLIGELQAEISQTLAQSEQPEAIKILCLASYRSLHQYDWCQKLECFDNLEEVKRRLIEEPLLEKMIAKDIPVLEEISDDVSLKVREQYEENPYPRWVKLGVSIKAKPIVAVCDELKLQLYSENIKNVTAPAILIAGCGTGQQSIQTAFHFSNCHVTAVDISLASLAYAQRKSNELRLNNIDYLQADILHLHQMGKEFDIIECVGVLHHMDEPMAGWRVLVNLLKPGGLMRIGLYSELARHFIAEVRKEITALRLGTSEADIRKFRQSLVESHDENHQLLTTTDNFFHLSGMIDLIFHVQEHRFTLPQIKNSLDELGLKFCGFEVQGIDSRFREFHGEASDIRDLVLWHEFEESNPHAFTNMYQFYCQKP
ncbi:tetratricopeptide repeat protein [Candidatus Njordibacter sp. Uisw_058]|uniref:tetratricopeptide repeat protein n=1 Tax=Candidatus Njordibacter sp. Uisw_058 TaxID=3230974 RepID=UPI003D44755B